MITLATTTKNEENEQRETSLDRKNFRLISESFVQSLKTNTINESLLILQNMKTWNQFLQKAELTRTTILNQTKDT